ncbi:murein biosynthesis integral membrane protein MurJ [Nocardiopsis sp. NPDC006198]|uniref:Murein biosynthesis integral membrane protein MurJ n=2 Tax=Nocardiopsidaceae TaxID=83676 RepID=A0ABY6YMN9_9ACTN|nr:murein biosynthesis integral membrane protein MurJ [Streptomonospora nanhaiensis]MEE2042192.1 murein biosynthesis integral membrane protein MurJ [Nocardiopsis tropica]WAE73555.1 murein biosynthesis integral membrane protein MurJ [Streptomonospora nanhaiensis]
MVTDSPNGGGKHRRSPQPEGPLPGESTLRPSGGPMPSFEEGELPEPGAVPAGDAASGSGADGAGAGSGSDSGGMMRSSMIMAVGTMASRLTGFARTIVLGAAIGTHLLGDAYHTAHTIPFILNDLLIGGLMASVIIPFLVKRRKNDADGGKATEDRLFTTTVLALFLLTAAAILAAEFLIWMYGSRFTPVQFEASVYLARFLLAQIFFVGLSGLLSAMLNTRGKFGAAVWAPVLNNVVIMSVAAVFLWVAGPGRTPETVTDGQLTLLGAGTAGGMLLQAVVLFVALSRTGYRWRPRLDLRGSGLGDALRTAGWMMLYTLLTQAGLWITTNIANAANVSSIEQGLDVGAGISAYNLAYQLFQLPYAIIAVSLITVLLPRMSAHADDRNWDAVRGDFSRTLRVSAFVLVPTAFAVAMFAEPLSVLAFARGSISVGDASSIGQILAVMSLGLVPFTVFQLMLRVFFAMGDTRTPAMIGAANLAVHSGLALVSYLLLPPNLVVVGVASGFMVSFLSGLTIAGLVLSRRIGGLDGKHIIGTMLRLHLAVVPSIAAGLGVLWFFDAYVGPGLASYIGAPVTGCVVGALLFLGFARLLRVPELSAAVELVRGRMRR